MNPTRAEHLAWCKQRALAYCDTGDFAQALASMGSDLNKHGGTAKHIGVELGLRQMMAGQLSSPDAMRKFINGFN